VKLTESNNISLSGADVKLRVVQESDARFILNLRNDERLKTHISPTSSDVDNQIEWIRNYKKRESEGKEFYFIFEDLDKKSWGTVRLYDLTDESFTIGSWLCLPGKNDNIAIRAWLLCIEFAFEKLDYNTCMFDIRKTNRTVLYFARLFNPEQFNEDNLNFYFRLEKGTFYKNREKVVTLLNLGNKK